MENLGNLAQSSLVSLVTIGAGSWVVYNPPSGPSFPAANFRVRVGSALTGEIVLVTVVAPSTPIAGQQTWTVSRGAEGTIAQQWLANTTVQHVLTKGGLDAYSLGIGQWNVVAIQTSAYGASPGDFVRCNTATAGFTVTLPDATTCAGHQVNVVKVSSDYNAVTLATTGGQTISGQSTVYWITPTGAVTAMSDGANWEII